MLLVEDSAVTQLMVKYILESAGAVVDAVEDGAEALQRCEQVVYDLILMDLQLPVMDGVATARELRRRGCATPIVALTGNAQARDVERCFEAGMNDCVGKPIEPDAVLATAMNLLHPGAARPEAMPAADARGRSAMPVDFDLVLARAGGKRHVADRMLQLFEEQFRDAGGELAAALAQGDIEGARRTTHLLKGGADTIGARRLADQAARLEANLSHRQAQEALPILEELTDSLSLVMKSLARATQA